MFLLFFTYLNQTRIRSLVGGVLMISDIIRPKGQQLNKPIVSYDSTYVA